MPTPIYDPPEQLNIADYFLDARIREGRGPRPALHTPERTWTYAEVAALAGKCAHVLAAHGVEPEHRVLIALPDGPGFVGVFFGTLKLGAVVVMVNPALPAADLRNLIEYSRARAIVTTRESAAAFEEARRGSRFGKALLIFGEREVTDALQAASFEHETFPTHRDDPAIWLFSGGTTGKPKAVAQTHRSFANTTECYAKGLIGYCDLDVTISVPKLYFGYATGSNLLFPFAVGASSVVFPEPVTCEVLYQYIARFKPTILVNVPTMVNKMLAHPGVKREDLASLRLATSAGEALPVELYERWKSMFGVDLLDGLGTAEMWHIFLSNAPGAVKPGTLGRVVPGFEVKVCDDDGNEVADGETGWLWVRGGSRATAYWQNLEKTSQGFRGEWYVSGDLLTRDADGYFTYCGRGDELLKVSGKWLAPQEVEGCLLEHPAVAEACVVGIADGNGLVKPVAYVVAREAREGLAETLKTFVREKLDAYKHPREVIFLDALPRTHLGKVDRGKLRKPVSQNA